MDGRRERPGGRDPISQKLRDLMYRNRKLKGWTVRDLAERAGISASYVSLIENGHKIPDAATIERLGQALEIDPKLLGAWVTVRGRSADAGEAIAAAQELASRLGLHDDMVAMSAAPMRALAANAPVPYIREPALPDSDRFVIGIPMADEGTVPGEGDEGARDRRPLWIDRQALPERDELSGAWAWRLSSKGTARVRGIYRRGDMVVISPDAWAPDAMHPLMVFAVRYAGEVVLSRASWTGTQLVLLPAGGAPPTVLDAGTERKLRELVAGRVILAVQRFR